MIQIWGGKRYKKDVANDTKYGVADDWMADETQPWVYGKAERRTNATSQDSLVWKGIDFFDKVWLKHTPLDESWEWNVLYEGM